MLLQVLSVFLVLVCFGTRSGESTAVPFAVREKFRNVFGHQAEHYLKALETVRQTPDTLSCTGTRRRRDIRDLSRTELQQWQNAINELARERDAGPSTTGRPPSFWDALLAVHIMQRVEAHGGAYFLPWHRLFLLLLENKIRERVPGFALPYWDWSVDADDAALSTIWSAGFAGGARRGPQPIPNGPFTGLHAFYTQPHPVRRNFNSGVSGEIRQLYSRTFLDGAIAQSNWADFSDSIEMAHDIVHGYIGGDMGAIETSPNDPMFYLHHTFVDSLWDERQRRTGNIDEFGGTHDLLVNGRFGPTNVRPNYVFGFFNVPASYSFNLRCVQYIPYSGSPTGLSNGGATPSTTLPADICGETDMMTPQRCRRGERIMERIGEASS